METSSGSSNTENFTYNTDGTVATVYNVLANKTLNITYKNGLPATNYVSGAPDQKDIYTVMDNKVVRVNYYETATVKKHSSYTYDVNGNLTGDAVIAAYATTGYAPDSSIIVRTYNSHKSAFYYVNGKFNVGSEGFGAVPLGGGNDFDSSTLFAYNTSGSLSIHSTITFTATYNDIDMPVQKKGFKDGAQIETADFTYLKKIRK